MKLKTYARLLTLFLIISVTNSNAATGDDKKPRTEIIATMSDKQKAARLKEIKNRVNEIKAMDFSTLSKQDRKALKKELRELRKEVRGGSGGVYLSTGAIIIILLILILVL